MNFGSKFVYVKRALSPSASSTRPLTPAASKEPPSAFRAAAAETETVDTNLLAVKFDVLQTPAQMHTGDVIRCTNSDCKAVLSTISKLTAAEKNPALKVYKKL